MGQKTRTRSKAASPPDTSHGRRGFPASGCWVNIFNPLVGELVGLCGYDYALIDMEHSPVTVDSALPMIRAVQLGGAKAIVRVPDKQPLWIGRLMDMGADGVMVPMVNTAEEALSLADAAVYAPQGSRGMAAGIVRASGYGVNTDHYLDNYRENFMLMVQMESREALENVNEIAAVSGVDCLFIGPFDLSGSLGNRAQPDHKVTRSAMRTISKAARTSDKLLSSLITPKRAAGKLFDEGYDLVFSGMDVTMLKDALIKDANRNKSHIASLGW